MPSVDATSEPRAGTWIDNSPWMHHVFPRGMFVRLVCCMASFSIGCGLRIIAMMFGPPLVETLDAARVPSRARPSFCEHRNNDTIRARA